MRKSLGSLFRKTKQKIEMIIKGFPVTDSQGFVFIFGLIVYLNFITHLMSLDWRGVEEIIR